MKILKTLFIVLCIPLLLGSSSFAQADPLGTAITYQGELRQSGQPANGTFDFKVGLYSEFEDGSPLDMLTLSNIAVVEGIFTVQLDFTAVPFDGEQAWLELSVRPGGSSGGYTGLLPRQKLTAVPYALKALSVTRNAIDSEAIAAGQVGNTELADNSVGTSKIVTNEVQRRVSGACPADTFLTGIAEDGGVICSVVPLGLNRTLDGGSGVGTGSSIVIRDSGLPVVSYVDGANKALKLYDCNNAACSSGTVRTLRNVGKTPSWTSIAIRASGKPVVSYIEDQSLKMHDCHDAACSTGTDHTLDNAGIGGPWTSIAIRSTDLPVVVYHGFLSKSLKLFDCDDDGCSAGTIRTLDSDGDVGRFASVAIRSSDMPVVSYFDGSTYSLKLYDCQDSGCSSGHKRDLDYTGGQGIYNSIAVRSSDLPVVSYHDSSSKRLKLFDCQNVGCSSGSIRTLDHQGDVGMYASIAIRDSDKPIVVYYDDTGQNSNEYHFKLYDCYNISCSSGIARTLDKTRGYAGDLSIAIGPSGKPVMSYYNTSEGALKLYTCGDERCEN